ncbi:GNAT family N-acetyltransferase [Sporobolomyces koalae]|uniref:GNAT family N-acetyltransferase n=1 Tax=Sporobolomyces koalae TaxID=500713 RepID=UPI0031734896
MAPQLYTKRSKLPITISPVTEQDMLECAEGQLTAFGTRMYADLEPLATRAPPEVRYKRFASRHARLLSLPSERPMKATVRGSDGVERIAGVTWWHVPGSAINNQQKRDVERMRSGRETDEEVESWRDFDWERWNAMLDKYDRVRKEIMRDEPHWYVGPVWTHPDFQGQGIASALLSETIALADSTNTPLYLEASPAGQPVYAKLGWVRVEGTETVMLRRRDDRPSAPA